MAKIFAGLLLLCISASGSAKSGAGSKETLEREVALYKMPAAYISQATELYKGLQLQSKGLEKDIFLKAYKGYLVLLSQGLVQNPTMLTIADFSQSNKNKRLYVIDLVARTLRIHTYVSHGRNSGGVMATSFSNVNNSNKSVLGFLVTADTYNGSNGLSLRFRGMEPGFNNMVTNRAIVVHGSKFVSEKELARRGEMVNSLGCPAVPLAETKAIIQAIKGGSVYFIYHPDENYAAKSAILNTSFSNNNFLSLPAIGLMSQDSAAWIVAPPALTQIK
ncbi:MAG TPA: murein L,D-transpeptidase catalytic domain family protein [Phnomibacter sp.]|nr:murein L,D-transpeptidase catalytic domain family protein [Phnomibacter sp.]